MTTSDLPWGLLLLPEQPPLVLTDRCGPLEVHALVERVLAEVGPDATPLEGGTALHAAIAAAFPQPPASITGRNPTALPTGKNLPGTTEVRMMTLIEAFKGAPRAGADGGEVQIDPQFNLMRKLAGLSEQLVLSRSPAPVDDLKALGKALSREERRPAGTPDFPRPSTPRSIKQGRRR